MKPHICNYRIVITTSCLLLLLFGIGISPVDAGSTLRWETPQWIPGLVDTDPAQYPVFLAGPDGDIHVFHSQWVNGVFTIVHSQWLVEIGWTRPVDIVIPPIEQARLTGAFLDESGEVNLIFWSGDEFNSRIYFTHVPLDMVNQASAWTKPVSIGPSAITPTYAALVGDGKGALLAIYSGQVAGNGIYSVSSTDGGETWTKPQAVFRTFSNVLWPASLKLVLSESGQVHAVWTINNVAGLGLTAYYASTDLKNIDWSHPFILAEATGFEAATPNLVEYDDELFIVYHNGFPSTRWMRRSSDNGNSWSSPVKLFDQVGSNGAASFAIDSGNTLHMFFGNRIGNPAIHGLWHSTWLGTQWSKPVAVVSGPQVLEEIEGEEGFDPSYAQSLIVHGNFLFVVWRHDPMAGPTHIWYTYQTLDTETIEIQQPLAKTEMAPDLQVEPTSTATAVLEIGSPTPSFLEEDTETKKLVNPIFNISAGVVPVVLIVGAVLYFRRRKK